MSKRPPGLVAIIAYKIFTATLLLLTALSLLLTLKHQSGLEAFAAALTLEGKRGLIAFVLDKLLQVQPRTLAFSSLVAGLYAGVTVVEATGLWLQKNWAGWLVILMVSLSLPPEIYELFHHVSLLKLFVLLLNLAILIYLLREFATPKTKS